MEEWQGSIDRFTGTHSRWFPELHDIGWVNTLVDNTFWRAGSPRGIEDIIRRGFGNRADGRPITTDLKPFLYGDGIVFQGRYTTPNNHQAHIGDVVLDSNEMLQQHVVYDNGR